MTREVPRDGWRTFVIVWVTQSLSMLGTMMTFFAVNIWLTQVLYPRPEQKAALSGLSPERVSATELARGPSSGEAPTTSKPGVRTKNRYGLGLTLRSAR